MSGGQHVGRLSDSLSDTEDREQQHATLKRLMQPPKRASNVRVDVANGDPCPADPAHGKMFVLSPSGNQWCPHSDHTAKRKF